MTMGKINKWSESEIRFLLENYKKFSGNPIKLKLKENEKIIAVKMVILLDEIKKNLRNANDIDLSLPKLRSVFVKIENSRSWSDETLQRSIL